MERSVRVQPGGPSGAAARGSHGPVSPAPPARPEPPGGDSPRGGTRAPRQPGTGTERHRGTCQHPPASPYSWAAGTSGNPHWTSQSLADIPNTLKTSWYPAGILGTCHASSYPVGTPSTWQAPQNLPLKTCRASAKVPCERAKEEGQALLVTWK